MPPLTPSSGTTAGGTSVIIIAETGFRGTVTAVKFGANAASFTVQSANQITATTPPGVPGVVDVVVKTTGGEWTDVKGFTYSTPVP
ncbi:MAG: IPT/TIG domain-containing protein [Chloroflexota bacterium]